MRSPQICSCSTAAARKVSPAASTTLQPLVAILLGELGDRRRLAAAVDADHENDEGLRRRVDAQRLRHRLDQPDRPVRPVLRGPLRAIPPG